MFPQNQGSLVRELNFTWSSFDCSGSVLSDWLVIMVVISAVSLSDVQRSQVIMTTANNSSFDGLVEQETSRHRLCENNVQEVSAAKITKQVYSAF